MNVLLCKNLLGVKWVRINHPEKVFLLKYFQLRYNINCLEINRELTAYQPKRPVV